jgi:hypothetical protein
MSAEYNVGGQVKLVTLLMIFSANAYGCSLVAPKPFVVRHGSFLAGSTSKPPSIKSAKLVGSLSADPEDSCTGVGFVYIVVSSRATKKGARSETGFIIRAKSGVNDKDFFPTEPMQPLSVSKGEAVVFWGWYSVTPNADGHLKWDLEVIEVAANGRKSRPAVVCVSTNDSCPPPPKSQLHGPHVD